VLRVGLGLKSKGGMGLGVGGSVGLLSFVWLDYSTLTVGSNLRGECSNGYLSRRGDYGMHVGYSAAREHNVMC
jgi:hypothetical protein